MLATVQAETVKTAAAPEANSGWVSCPPLGANPALPLYKVFIAIERQLFLSVKLSVVCSFYVWPAEPAALHPLYLWRLIFCPYVNHNIFSCEPSRGSVGDRLPVFRSQHQIRKLFPNFVTSNRTCFDLWLFFRRNQIPPGFLYLLLLFLKLEP